MGFMTEITKEEVNETLFSLGKMSARLPSDEGKRLFMMGDILNKYISQLETENYMLRNGDDFDMDGRC
jgi:hypothetical protein